MVCSIKTVFAKIKNGLCWFMLCTVVFLVSIFIHELGHGLANSLQGIECSTGFNRVGDSYKYPKDTNFREDYSSAEKSFLDFGVPATLGLAIVGTLCFYKAKRKRSQMISLAFAITNSMLRLIPCLYVILVPLITGKSHMEDEYEMGLMLAQTTKISGMVHLPTILSILISAICIAFLFHRLKQNMSVKTIWGYGILTFISFETTMIIANILDNIIRINWVTAMT